MAKAFGLAAKKDLLRGGDAGPVAPRGAGMGPGCGSLLLLLVVIVIIVLLLRACEDENWTSRSGTGYTSSSRGGSWGGGAHK